MINAADLYRKAFACLPDGDLDADTRRLGRDDPEMSRFVERGLHSLDLLHQAVRCAECNWGLEAALGVPIDDFSGGRRLAMLALLRAEESFRRGDDCAGLDDLAAVMALGRHLGRGMYVSGLAGFPIEGLAATKALEVLGGLDPANCRAFAERLDSLPPFPELSEALRAEQTYFQANYREKFAALDDGDVPRPIREAFGIPARTEGTTGLTEWVFPDGDPAERMLLSSGGTRSGLLALADEVLAAWTPSPRSPSAPKTLRPRSSPPSAARPVLTPSSPTNCGRLIACARSGTASANASPACAPSPPPAAWPPTPIAPTLQPESREIARLLGIGRTSVWRILSGYWRE